MKKIIFGIFAHPDDEAFGPAGTLLLETQNGAELHLITLTDGGGGANPDNLADLGEARLKEWKAAGTLLGAKSMHFLGYQDGRLNNHILLESADRVTALITSIITDEPSGVEIEFMTFDKNGLTGHIDHIVASRAACLAFYRMQETDARFKRIRFFCLPHAFYPHDDIRWLYMERGPQQVDETIDARHLNDRIAEVMRAHRTQRQDAQFHFDLLGDTLGLNHFIISTGLADQES